MKLLHYTSLRHLLFASLLTLISIPLFYILLNDIFVRSIDKDLSTQASQIPTMVNIIKSPADLQLWKVLDNDLEVIPMDSTEFHDRPFTQQKMQPGAAEPEDFRILQKKVQIMGKPYVVNIESSLFEKDDLIRAILIIQLGILILLLTGTVGINYFVHKRIWKPFYDALDYLRQFNIETEGKGLAKGLKIQEFSQLSQSVSQLSIRVRQAYYSQKEFIENASHELQTPLTILKFKLELLLQDNELTEQQDELIGDMYREIEHMQELNSNLLLLSKIENGQFVSEETLLLAQILQELKEDLSLLAQAKDQQIQLSIIDPKAELPRANKALFKIMVSNLMTNAIQYSAKGSQIEILLTPHQLEILNPGQPLGMPAGKIFKRFFGHNKQLGTGRERGNHGEQKGNGNGLGLSICQSIARYHHMKIEYKYEAGRHRFVIQW